MSEANIKEYLRYFDSSDGIKILQQLPIQGMQYFELLTNTSGIFEYNSKEQTFFNGLTTSDNGNDAKQYIDYMLKQISLAQFMQLMRTDYNGINGAQLLALFMDSDQLKHHVQQLNVSKRWELISLFKSQITTEHESIIKNLSTRNTKIDKAIQDISQLSGEKFSKVKEVIHRDLSTDQKHKFDR